MAGSPGGLWFAASGLGLVLVAWLGTWIVLPLALDVMIHGLFQGQGFFLALVEGLLLAAQIGISWWLYHPLGKGSRQLADPRSATLFLLLVPGGLAALFAFVQALAWQALAPASPLDLWALAGVLWLSRALGILVLAPTLLVNLTPWLVKHKWAIPEDTAKHPLLASPADWTWGEAIEISGLAFATAFIGAVLVFLRTRDQQVHLPLWGVALLLIVWSSLRQGLRGGALVATAEALVALFYASSLELTPILFSPLQGHLLAQCSVALLVGGSAGWIRASEARYRQMVGHIPVVLYSARLTRPLEIAPVPSNRADRERLGGPALRDLALVTLVGPASRQVFGCEPEALLGPYRSWFWRILPADHELVIGALGQLCLQKEPVVCEYRLDHPGGGEEDTPLPNLSGEAIPPPPRESAAGPLRVRWVRETMVPYYLADGRLDGWEGVVEDITEQRALAQDLRRTTAMLQALVAHLPTGIFFVHGNMGLPLLVNMRARQLLGQREDLAAGIMHLAKVYRLHRPDGTEYPWEELPVTKALRLGTTFMANDIVVHRPDGRRIPLVTWAAPVDLIGLSKPEAAVWVFEDMTALKQAEAARRESEARLRAVVETMAEGLLVLNHAGVIIQANLAASAILGLSQENLVGQTTLGPEGACFREDESPFPREEQPDWVVLQTGQPVRDVVMGLSQPDQAPEGKPLRWLLVNAMPLPQSPPLSPRNEGRVVVTFADITAHRQMLKTLRAAKEKYQELVETLPLMVLQFDRAGHLIYLNPATREITGYRPEQLSQPGFWQTLLVPEQLREWQTALERTLAGYHSRFEFRYQGRDGSLKVGYALAQPLRQDGSIMGSTCLVVDMTAQRRLEQELQRSQRLELVGRVASGTVHDFNNLLTVMMGLAAQARSSLAADHPTQGDISRIIDAGEQAAHLAGQLLTFSKHRRKTPHSVDLNIAVVHTLRLLRGTLPRNIMVESHLAPRDLTVHADETQLKQVVMNLCLNARDAMPDGGTLKVQTQDGAKPASLPFPVPEEQHWACLSVQDEGIGMDEEVKARIFEPFFSTKENGSGLGLAVVKQIIESFGGQIEVSSQPQQGTRLDIWLPLAQ